MKRNTYYLSPYELSPKAFKIYSESGIVVKGANGKPGYYIDDHYFNDLKELNEYLEAIADILEGDD